jgi:hypothetical protein
VRVLVRFDRSPTIVIQARPEIFTHDHARAQQPDRHRARPELGSDVDITNLGHLQSLGPATRPDDVADDGRRRS